MAGSTTPSEGLVRDFVKVPAVKEQIVTPTCDIFLLAFSLRQNKTHSKRTFLDWLAFYSIHMSVLPSHILPGHGIN